MKIFLHNTASRSLEEFIPLNPALVRMYVCGPTVYNYAHLGNARPSIVFDVLNQLLRRHFKVRYVRNITDIDDKIIERSLQTGLPINEITDLYTREYQRDMLTLGNTPPDLEPRATNNIDTMIKLISVLIERGHAYTAEGHVLFDVSSNPRQGSLMGIDLDGLRAGARVDKAPYKRNPEDFVLWKPSPVGWPSWESPWGAGRPGWHIECSAMAGKHLGVYFDIHGGGHDLAFPHHENENAQTTCAHGTKAMANYWLHNGMLLVNGKKMSKSLDNFITIRDMMAKGHWAGEAFRLMVLKTHYRSPMDFTYEGLEDTRKELDSLYRKAEKSDGPPPEEFENALASDLNTSEALALMHAEKDPQKLFRMGSALGLFAMGADAWAHGTGTALDIEDLIKERNIARLQKRWADADAFRMKLSEMGIVLEDGPSGTTWRKV